MNNVLTTDHNATTNSNGISISEVCLIPCGRVVTHNRLCATLDGDVRSHSLSHVLMAVTAAVQIVSLLGGQYNRSDVQGAVIYLSDQGHAFTTCDDEHYKSTAV